MLHDMKLSQSRLEYARWHSEASGVLLRLCNAAWLQADGFEIAPSLLLCLPHPRPSGLCTHNKPALLLHPSVFLNVCLLKSSSQPSLCYSTFSLLRISRPIDFCHMETVCFGLRWFSVLGTHLLCLSLSLIIEKLS